MFSRLALKSAFAPRASFSLVQIKTTQTSAPLSAIHEGSERDLVNFPRRVRHINCPPTRMGFLPEEWFTFFYNKTGVTGPYLLGVGAITFMFSKEFYVIDHEFVNACTLVPLLYFLCYKFGPSVAAFLDKEIDAEDAMWKKSEEAQMVSLIEANEGEKKAQWHAEGGTKLFDAKKESVAVQLEAQYRQRLVEVHTQVKKQLDYQVEVVNVKNRMEQKQLVDWVVKTVRTSITPAQEAAALKKCFTDLKALSAA